MTYKIKNLCALIFTDLDASFLNKSNFSFGNNMNITKKIFNDDNFVIFNTSKTFIELNYFFQQQSYDLPFICENGGGIYSPKRYFNNASHTRDGYNVIFESTKINKKISKIKRAILQIFGEHCTFYNDLNDFEKQKFSGLNEKELMNASRREFTELIIWKSDYENLIKFNDYLHTHDLKIIKGGRFHHISNNINKGISMLRLVNEYKKYYPSKKFVTIAIGDSENDLEMLNCVDYPCLVKSNDSQTFIKNIKSSNLFISDREAPEGWEDCVNQAFEQIRRQ